MTDNTDIEEQETGTDFVEESAEQPVPQSLTLKELDQIAQVIDLASTRGAFRGNELSTVGSLYNKLADFLSYVQAQQEAAKAAAEETTEEQEDSSTGE